MNWSQIKNSITESLINRGLSNPNIRINALNRIESLLKERFPDYVSNPKISFGSIDKNALKKKIASVKSTKRLSGAESSIINEIYYRI